jgi:uncharacterized protein (TIGR02996 family)
VTITPRNLALEARVAANPYDRMTLGVYADYLQAQGDPWGELIAFALAGEHAEAKRVFADHEARFHGGHPTEWFTWEGAFIDRVIVSGLKGADMTQAVREVLALPAMLLARELRVVLQPGTELIASVTERAPPRLTTFFCWLSDAVGELAVPTLEHLHLMLVPDVHLSVERLAPVLALRRMPKLRRVDLYEGPIPLHFLEALVDSPLCRQLDWLELLQGALDVPTAQLLLDRRDALAHIRVLALDPPDALGTQVRTVFRTQLATYQSLTSSRTY